MKEKSQIDRIESLLVECVLQLKAIMIMQAYNESEFKKSVLSVMIGKTAKTREQVKIQEMLRGH